MFTPFLIGILAVSCVPIADDADAIQAPDE